MRKKNKIKKDIKLLHGWHAERSKLNNNKLMLEVLLDIRDLLDQINKKK